MAIELNKRAQESKCINTSLHALRKVIRNVANSRGGKVSFRDSKLTQLLRAPLQASGKTTILLACSDNMRDYAMTTATFDFGAEAGKVVKSIDRNRMLSLQVLSTLTHEAESMLLVLDEGIKAIRDSAVFVRSALTEALATTPPRVRMYISSNPLFAISEQDTYGLHHARALVDIALYSDPFTITTLHTVCARWNNSLRGCLGMWQQALKCHFPREYNSIVSSLKDTTRAAMVPSAQAQIYREAFIKEIRLKWNKAFRDIQMGDDKARQDDRNPSGGSDKTRKGIVLYATGDNIASSSPSPFFGYK